MSDSLQPHGLQHTRLPCPLPTPGACSNSCPSSQWFHPTISSSVVPFSSCLQSSQHQGLFQWVSSLNQVAEVLELQFQHQSFQWILWMDWLDFLVVQGTLKNLLQHYSSKASILQHSAFFMVQLSYPYMTTGKTIALTMHIFVGKVKSLLFNMLSRDCPLPGIKCESPALTGRFLTNRPPRKPATVYFLKLSFSHTNSA